MTARDLGLIVTDRLRAERRRFELFRKGIVTAVDTSVVPNLVWVNDGSQARPMPHIDPVIAVGDVVQWVDQSDPFCWAKADGFEVPGNMTSSVFTIRGKSFSSSGDGGVGSGTFYDYDQGITGKDSIILNPYNRANQIIPPPVYWWTGGVAAYDFACSTSDHTTDFVKTDISGDDLNPALHSDWDGTIVPPLPGPVVDEYVNLGGNGAMNLRTFGNIGTADLPGFHSHAVSVNYSALSNSHGSESVLRNVASIVTKNIATELTTVNPGERIPWPTPLFAPGPDWLMLFLAHFKPINYPSGSHLQDIHIHEEDEINDPYSIGWNGGSGTTNVGKWGQLFWGDWRSWEARTYTPEFSLENILGARQIAFSSMLCTYRTETV